MSSNIVATNSAKQSFWDRPEGLWGMIPAVLVAGGIGYGLYKLIPFIIKLGLGLLGIGIIWGVIAGLGILVFTDNPLRRAISLKYQLAVTKFYNDVIRESPIEVRRLIQTKARKRLDEARELMVPVKAAKSAVKASADKFNGMSLDLHAQYNLQERACAPEEDLSEILSQIGAIDKELEDMKRLSEETEVMDITLQMAIKRIKKVIDKAQFDIDVMETKLVATKSVANSWKKLRSIFTPSSQEEEERLAAERASEEKLHQQLGEIDQCMTEFNEVLTVLNSKDALNAEKARIKMKSLKQYQVEEPVLVSVSKPETMSMSQFGLSKNLNKVPAKYADR